MITTEGKNYIKRYLAGFVPNIAEAIAIGAGNASESTGDARLQFEIARSTINLTSFDFVNNKLIFKAPADVSLGGTVYEIGLFSKSQNASAGAYASRLISAFESSTEDWVDTTASTGETFVTGNLRVGLDGLFHSPAASATKSSSWREISLDLSGNSNSDIFTFTYNVGNGSTSALRFLLLVDASNYYEFNLGAQTAGYKIINRAKGTATVVGSPSWSSINEIRVVTTSTGGTSAITFDGIRIEDTDTINPDYILVARKVLSTPFVLETGKTQAVEYALDINI